MFSFYKLPLLLFETFNDAIPKTESLWLNFDQVAISTQQVFIIVKNNKLLVGLEILCNRLHELYGKIPLDGEQKCIQIWP